MISSSNKRYADVLLKYAWLLIVAAVIAGAAGYLFRSRQAPTYESEVRVFIGNSISSPDTSLAQLDTGARLAQTYAQLITYELLQHTIELLQLPLTADELRGIVSTAVVSETPILIIKVVYEDPEQAALIANQIAELLIADSPSNLTSQELQRMLAIQGQIDNLESEIASQRTEATQLLEQVNLANEDEDTETALQLTEDYNRLLEQINTSRTILAQLSDTYLQLSNRTNRLEIIERARAVPEPTGIKAPIISAAGAIVGLIFAAAAVIYFEYANTSLRTTEEVETVLQVPVLGRISHANWINKNKKTYLVVDTHTQSRLAEDYRNLRINLLASTRTASPSICIVTSPSPREGKSVTVVNLAAAMALADLDVLLIDADLRRPVLHEVLGVSNLAGLTTALFSENNRDKQQIDVPVKDLVQKTRIPKLWVLTAGYTTERSTEVFGSDRMTKLLDSVCEKYAFDVILIDTPPVLAVSDAAALAVATSASVMLVINAGRTHWNLALKAKKQLEQLNVNLVGAVLNRTRSDQDGTSTSYYH